MFATEVSEDWKRIIREDVLEFGVYGIMDLVQACRSREVCSGDVTSEACVLYF